MTNKGQHTFNEIMTQPVAWADALQAFMTLETTMKQAWAVAKPRQVVFTGCGSTYFLARTAAFLLQSLTGVPARAQPASEIALFGSEVLPNPERTLLVAVSRSGATSETLAAVNWFRGQAGQAVWAITCAPGSDLAQVADLVLPAEAAQEQSLAQTRSFATMLLLAQAMAATLGGQNTAPLSQLSEAGQRIVDESGELMAELGGRLDVERFYFLGSGLQYGIACEAMLKMTEMSLSASQAYHTLEFRHGPMSMVDEWTLVAGLFSRPIYSQEVKVLDEMAALGASTLALTPLAAGSGATYEVHLDHHLPAWALPVLYLPPLQLLAYHRAVSKGLDPDKPRNLHAVIYLDRANFP